MARSGLRSWLATGRRLTWPNVADVCGAVRITTPAEPTAYAAKLYASLHDLDGAGVERIVVAMPPEGDDWLAVADRLNRARHRGN